MTKSEFEEIYERGFNITKFSNNNTELKCFECGENTVLTSSIWKTELKCKNNHKYTVIDYLIEHISIRDGLLRNKIEKTCSFNYPPKSK